MQNIHGDLLYTAKIKRRHQLPNPTLTLGSLKWRISSNIIVISVIVISLLLSMLLHSWFIVAQQKQLILSYKEQLSQQTLANLQLSGTLEKRTNELIMQEREFELFKTDVEKTIASLNATIDKTLKDISSKK